MSSMFKPDQLPRPPNFGYLGDLQVPQPDLRYDAPDTPQQVDSFVKQNYEQPATIPDSLRARYGAGDPKMVGALLRAANGQESGLNGVPPTYATKLLQQWGFPTTMDAWDANTWDTAIKGHASDQNPLTLLRGY